MCHEWLKEFRAFLRDMGERPFGCTLDRVDNDSGYHKENCRWATMKAQGRNRRTNRIIEFNGERLSMIEWTEKLGYRKDVIRSRLKEGWTIERALTTPQAKVWRVAGGSGT